MGLPSLDKQLKRAIQNAIQVNGHDLKTEQRQGRSYLVVPIVALKEMVLHCASCHYAGEFISAEELSRSVQAWNGRPVTINHPEDEDGFFRLANTDPGGFDSVKVGEIWNTSFDGDRLRMDLWLDTELMRGKGEGPEVLARLNADDELLEVSTGYLTDRAEDPGTFRGNSFALRQTNIVPDHLALLPTTTGACSVQHGCGGPRMNQLAEGETVDLKVQSTLLAGITAMLKAAWPTGSDASVAAKEPSPPPEGGTENGNTGGGATPPEPAKEENVMKRDDILKALAGNAQVSAIHDDKALAAMTDEQLKGLAGLAGIDCGCPNEAGVKPEATPAADPAPTAAPEGAAPTPVVEEEETPEGEPEPTGLSANTIKALEEVAKMVPALTAIVTNAADTEAKERGEIVARLVANESCTLGEASLKELPITVLRGLDDSFQPARGFDFAGQGGPQGASFSKGDESFVESVPVMLRAPEKAPMKREEAN